MAPNVDIALQGEKIFSFLLKIHDFQFSNYLHSWVTNMHALNLVINDEGIFPSKREIDAYLDGNICRCTGYKPILKAFQTFSHHPASSPEHNHDHSHAPHTCPGICASKDNCQKGFCGSGGRDQDLEDVGGNSHATFAAGAKSLKRKRDQKLVEEYVPQPLLFYNPISNKRWIRPVGLDQLCAVLTEYSNSILRVQLVGGNTSIGITKYLNDSAPYNTADSVDVYVDINEVPIMTIQQYDETSGTLTVGSAVSINTLLSLLQKFAPSTDHSNNPPTGCFNSEINHHSIFSVTAHHLSRIANTQVILVDFIFFYHQLRFFLQVRNAGSWAGNLMIFLQYKGFPSDALLALATAKVMLQLCDLNGSVSYIDMVSFIEYDYEDFLSQGLMIVALIICEPSVKRQTQQVPKYTITETFKVAQRAANAHPHVNAGFNFEITPMKDAAPLCTSARVVFGGVSKRTFVAKRTEKVLTNSRIQMSTLKQALSALELDLNEVGENDAYGNQIFRHSVMQNYLYQALLRCYPVHQLPHNVLSAVLPMIKPASRRLFIEVFSCHNFNFYSFVKYRSISPHR
jgi:xanthine dehydrogenase/oxidase